MPIVKFKRQGSNTAFGNFGPGDVLRCSDAMARHLVVDTQVADYQHTTPQPPAAAPAPRRKRATRKEH